MLLEKLDSAYVELDSDLQDWLNPNQSNEVSECSLCSLRLPSKGKFQWNHRRLESHG